MSYTREERLAAKVKAVNKANALAMQLYTLMVAVFADKVGEKILKVNGDLLGKIQKLLPEIPFDRGSVRAWRHRSDYSLAWTVSVSEPLGDPNGHHSVIYHEVTAYIGSVSGDILTGITNPVQRKTDYDVATIFGLRLAYEKAKHAADDALNTLDPFGTD